MAETIDISVTLGSELVGKLREFLEEGDRASDGEVVRLALTRWLERERKLSMLDDTLQEAIAQADAGMCRDIDEVREELLGRFAAREVPEAAE